MDEEGFQIVTQKRKFNHHHEPRIPLHALQKAPVENSTIQHVEVDKDDVIRKILLCREELKTSELYMSLSIALRHSLERFCEEHEESTVPVVTLVCYGLGNFSSCIIARYQLALFLCLKEDLNADGLLYDPAFSSDERLLLTRLLCTVIEHNEEGKRHVDAPTLFYMPHCAKELYNNLLWANWSPSLSKLVILGNSFSHMMDNLPHRQFEKSWNYISKVFPLVEEYGVKNCFRYNDIFNDTSIHIFPKTKMACVQHDFWLEHDEPIYQDINDC